MPGHHERSSGRHHRGIAEGGGPAAQHVAQRISIVFGVTALEVVEGRALDADLFRRQGKGGDRAVLQLGNPSCAGGHDFVHAAFAVADPAGLAAEVLQHLCQGFHPLLREHAGHLALRTRRVGKGPEQVENGARAQFDARRTDELHRGVVRGREHEAKSGFRDTFRNLLWTHIDFNTQGNQHIRRAGAGGQRAVAVLGNLKARTGSDEGCTGRDVVGARGITARADDVDGISWRRDWQHLLAHDLDRAGDLVHCLAAHT